MKPRPLYIFDLDGTLALIEHRRHFVENRANRWKEFFEACVDDVPNKPVIAVLKALLKTGAEVWVFSGRSDAVRKQTEYWCERHLSWFPVLQMRRDGDHTRDHVLKKQWLDSMLPEDRERLVTVFDDRDRAVKMWRNNGITCLQVAPGAF